MLVKYWMSPQVYTIDAEASMQDAVNIMKKHTLRMLPVIRKEKLVGILSDRDLKRASASDATTLEIHELLYLLSKIKVKDIMSKHPIPVSPNLTVEETAEILLKNKISGAPVLDDRGKIVGIITQSDIFKLLISLTGIDSSGIQFAFRLEDRPGSIKAVADVIRSFGGRMVSIMTSYENVEKGFRKVYIRMHSIDRQKLTGLKERLQSMATLLYMVDHRENRREVFMED
jgi:acetoin utilization protein AcuB